MAKEGNGNGWEWHWRVVAMEGSGIGGKWRWRVKTLQGDDIRRERNCMGMTLDWNNIGEKFTLAGNDIGRV